MTTQAATKPVTAERTAAARQMVSFSFYKVHPEWLRLPAATKRRQAADLAGVVTRYAKRLLVLTYSLIGMKADVDFLIWRVGTRLEELQEMSAAIQSTALGGYLSMPYAYLSMTKRASYVDKLDPEHQERRLAITPARSPYLFVYPFTKTREWYQLPLEERQTIMDEHIAVGNRYPSVKLHTTYSFGLDDQEFVVAFETDRPQDFLDLVMELRSTKASRFTLRDTPILSCVAMPLSEIFKQLVP